MKPKVEKGRDGFWRCYCPHFGRVQAFRLWTQALGFAYHCATEHGKVMAYR